MPERINAYGPVFCTAPVPPIAPEMVSGPEPEPLLFTAITSVSPFKVIAPAQALVPQEFCRVPPVRVSVFESASPVMVYRFNVAPETTVKGVVGDA